MQSLLLLLPDFALILLGWGLRRALHLGDHFWSGLERLVYFILFPALLFNALARNPIAFGEALPVFLAAAGTMAAGMALAMLLRPLYAHRAMMFASHFQCGFRFNSYIGLAIAGKLHGAVGVAAMGMTIGAMVPLANLAAVGMLARHGELGMLRELARNPLIWATVAGLVYSATGLPYGGPPAEFLTRLSNAAITLGLLAVGSALKVGKLGAPPLPAALLTAIKLFAVPAVAWWLATTLGLHGLYFDTVVLFGALPTASSAYILAMRMGGDGPGVAWLISAGTLAAVVSLSFWLSLLR